jgi:propionyl-CoA carboxylase alpha chain
MTAFASLLVANRGEIARRIFRSARAMGLRCIAVYADADRLAPFVAEADEAIRLPGGYLDASSILEAARATGADAVHPGYGFLSENAAFAAAVVQSGLVWVGPPPSVIDVMGDKLEAKRAAIAAGVPTLPSCDDPAADHEVGYPLLVKAAAGGGGKGMRVVESPAELADAVAAARREAAGSFGDDRVFLERYVARSRHVEIQILGDAHGSLVHLGERECSIQRRHQKIIEESPSPVVDSVLRNAMGDAALRLAKAIDYQSAGTVEFLLEEESREFYFLEVNTRLQVEHPVTELITGIDLVREQLRIAAGEALGYEQAAVSSRGHAIEARLYAEDPASGFLPSTGRLAAFRPAADPDVRWDSGVEAGSVIGVEFDPMLAKVIAHAETRSEAASRLALALARLHLGGVTTNRDFLVAVLRSPDFLAGSTTTDFIERNGPAARRLLSDDETWQAVAAAALWLQGQNRVDAAVLERVPSGWCNGRLPAQSVTLQRGGDRYHVEYRSQRDGSFLIEHDGCGPRTARVHQWCPDAIDLELDGRRCVHVVTACAEQLHVQLPATTVSLAVVPRFQPPQAEDPAGALTAPMPAAVVDVRVTSGQRVAGGDVLVLLEAMKMEHHIRAPADAVVSEVCVRVGEQVSLGAILLVLDPLDSAADAADGTQVTG